MVDVEVMRRVLFAVYATAFSAVMSSFEEVEYLRACWNPALVNRLIPNPMLPCRSLSQYGFVFSFAYGEWTSWGHDRW